MAKEIEAEVIIHVSPAKVWEALTDLASYPQWNPFIRKASGEVKAGARLKMNLKIPDGFKMRIRPKLLTIIPKRELRWIGCLMVPGLFDGEHRLLIKPVQNKNTQFIQKETFRGILVPLFGGMISRGALRGFQTMSQALKERVERQDR